jgi:CRISPR/Cas system endoribonuclease Cas6 (RAMP superfamily)
MLLHFQIQNSKFLEFRKHTCENKAPFSRNTVHSARAMAWLYQKMMFSRIFCHKYTTDTQINYMNRIRLTRIWPRSKNQQPGTLF